MAVKGINALTLTDWAKRTDPNGKIDKIVELLAQTNPILQDMMWVEGNLPTGHRTTVRTGLPSTTWRMLNYGVQPSKSTTVQVTDACGMLEAYAEVDKALADLNGNTSEFRLSEDRAFLEAMNQNMSETVFYGDTSINPERFMGLSGRYSDKGAANGKNIIDAGGAQTDNASIWLMCWGENTVHGIFPKGSKAGLNHEDLGQQTLIDANGGKYEGYRTHYKWDAGMTLRDWRYVVRIANLDTSDLADGSASAPDICKLMAKALHRLPNRQMGKCSFYMNKDIAEYLDTQAMEKPSLGIKVKETEGVFWNDFRGVPIRECDALLNTESRVQ
ncbi:hypothetical protein ABKE32_000488 [Escherichia albertii]|uniref:major capsid protein n=1 Tax=Escherichia albertii TaxID=208962 RepID=UPI000743B643|nr:hypothetical protein [Escherichia albertii]